MGNCSIAKSICSCARYVDTACLINVVRYSWRSLGVASAMCSASLVVVIFPLLFKPSRMWYIFLLTIWIFIHYSVALVNGQVENERLPALREQGSLFWYDCQVLSFLDKRVIQ